MKVRTLIISAAVVLLCGGLGVAQEAPSPAASPAAAKAPSSSEHVSKHHAKHHRRRHGKHYGQKEFTEQQLQEMQTHPQNQ